MPLPYGRLLHPRPALTNCKSRRTQHWELPQDTHKTQTYNICMTKHSYFPYTSTCSSTPHNTNRKHNIHHIPYTNTQHTSTLQGLKNNIFNNGRYTTNIPTDPHTVTTTDIKTNMSHIHTSIVSRHLSTRCNNKVLHTPPLHISSEEILATSLVAPLPNLEQINHPFSNHTYIKSTPNHIHHQYAPFVTLTYTTHIISSKLHPHTHHIVTPVFMDISRRSDGTAGWWTLSGKIGLPPPLARVKGVGRQQQGRKNESSKMLDKRSLIWGACLIYLYIYSFVFRTRSQTDIERRSSWVSCLVRSMPIPKRYDSNYEWRGGEH